MDLTDAIAALGAATEPTPVPLGDKTVRVLPPLDWRQDAMDAIRAMNYNLWLQLVLVNDRKVEKDGTVTGSNDPQIWRDANPTNRELAAFIQAYAAAAGQPPGESQPSQS